MQLELLKAKIHRATVTDANLNYEGSITIARDLMDAAGILPFEKVGVLDVNNGNRLDTYVIEGKAGSGVICLNGAAARLVQPGDLGLDDVQAQAKESPRTLKEAREIVEREVISRALRDSNANLTLAATILGIDRKVLREIMERLGMKKEDFKK